MHDNLDPDTLRKEFADYCDEVAPGIKAKAPLLNQMETLALIGITLFQACKELKAEKAEQAARIAALESENRELSEFVIAVGGFWGNSKSKLVGELSLAEVINRGLGEEKDAKRYRWLKSKREDFDLIGRNSCYATELWNSLGCKPSWDEAIDAAIAAFAEKKG